jgi:hypothetical protein
MTHPPKPGTARAAFQEMRKGTFIGNAQRRATRRKSPWNLLLLFVFPLWLYLWFKSIAVLWNLACLARGAAVPLTLSGWVDRSWSGEEPMSWARALYMFAPLIPELAGSMVLANFVIYLIPPARRAMDNEDRAFPGTEYSTAQRTLGRITLLSLPPALLLSFLGAWLLVPG